MSLGLVGRKVGMTRIFTDDGDTIPVTVVDVSDNRVTQIKTAGNRRLRRGAGRVRQAPRDAACSKAAAGHFAKAASKPGTCCGNSASTPKQLGELKVGGSRSASTYSRSARRSTSPARTHRQGLRRRHQAPPLLVEPRDATATRSRTTSPARSGMEQDPGRVFPGKRMPGHLGDVKRTVAEPGDRAHRCRAPAAARQGRGARARRAATSVVLSGRASTQASGRKAGGQARGETAGERHGTQTDRPSKGKSTRTVNATDDSCSGATTTKRWCTRSSPPIRRTRASARARRRTAAR